MTNHPEVNAGGTKRWGDIKVEGACRHLVKDRMEQTGMRWRIAGAQAILGLRALYVNEDWDAFHADPNYKFAGLWSFVRYVVEKRRGSRGP